jgi:predicted transcriptional regulator
MTPKDLLLNFVRQYKKPFSVESAANLTGLPASEIEQMLPELITENLVKRISETESIYVRCQRYNPIVGYNQKGDWKFDPQAASALLDLLDSKQYNSIRVIAKDFGRSRQWVFVYLEALASLGIIGVKGRICNYYVITRDNLNQIGSQIKPGILGDLRSPHGEKRKQVSQANKEKREQERQEMLERSEQREKKRQAIFKTRQLERQEQQRRRQAAKNKYIAYLHSMGCKSD